MTRRQRGWGAAGLVALLGGLLAGCASAPTTAPVQTPRLADGEFLVSPLDGYPRSLSAAEAEALREAHRGLVAGEEPEMVASVASRLLQRNPDLDPARVLRAQSGFVSGRYEEVLADLEGVVEAHPDYVAAQLVAGRAAERLERPREAFEFYLRVELRSGLAGRRVEALRERAVEIAANRTRDLLARGRLDEARHELELVAGWAPDRAEVILLTAEFAAAAGNPEIELDAVKRLLEIEPSDALVRRRARLEMEAGDAGEGLRILEELTLRYPEDSALALELERAKFRWRLDLLPADVRQLLRAPELTRGDYAKLLFWLFPDVRYGRPSRGRIASDILDHPNRQEIARVINLDFMRMDSTLHLFHPDRFLSRQETLESVLKILAGRNPRPACLGADEPALRMSIDRLCSLAVRCGLVSEPGDCLPRAVASGRFVEDIGFTALDVLGVE